MLYRDIQKAFRQIQIREPERSSLRSQLVEILESRKIKNSRFTRLVFGVTQSPFILKGTLKIGFENSRPEFEKTVSRIKKDTYVDDLVTRGNTLDEVSNVKKKSVELFQKGIFITYKGNSNMSGRESHNVDVESELTFAKQIFNHDEI